VYGMGSVARLLLPFLLKENVKIKAIVDRNLRDKYVEGIKVIRPCEVEEGEYVIVTPFIYKDEIEDELGDKCNLIFIG